jgi:hypothetical protein
MRIKNTVEILIFVISMLGLGAGVEAQISYSGPPLGNSSGNPGVLPPQSHAFGKTYSEWSAEWWQWVYSLPADQHPLTDTADCSAGQSGKVWFLGGTYTATQDVNGNIFGEAERNCSVPSGKALYIPIVNAECNTIEDPAATDEDLRDCANFLGDHIQNLAITVDDVELKNLQLYRVESPPYSFGPLPANNLAGGDAGAIVDSVGDGIYVMLAPLSKGKHTIHFEGAAIFTLVPDGFDFTFSLDITYHITVGK